MLTPKLDPGTIEKIARAPFLMMVLDYDGTLTPIVKRPSLARLDSRMRAVLGTLAGMRNVRIAIVSGRALSGLERLVGVKRLDYVGNHGLERKIRGVHEIDPCAIRVRGFVLKFEHDLKKALKGIPGIFIENKVYSLSVHYRNVPAALVNKARRIFRKVWDDFSAQVYFHIRPGKKVWEVRPVQGCSDKGGAVRLLRYRVPREKRKRMMMVCVGDDKTDEDAFAALRRSDISIGVGGSVRHARFRLRSPEEVLGVLQRIVAIRKKELGSHV
ncbi:MAG TPA: trehalose-phosphatase [Candidatus Omnitrophota bacterium]|nr:trehalose-phosphatase [Candidatus Omnitrophota bacterium]